MDSAGGAPSVRRSGGRATHGAVAENRGEKCGLVIGLESLAQPDNIFDVITAGLVA